MSEWAGTYYSHGQEIRELDPRAISPFLEGTSYYEVLRVMSGTCLFAEDHLQRLNESLILAGLPDFISSEELIHSLQSLIAANKAEEGNIRIVAKIPEGQPLQWIAYFVPHSYPAQEQYERGVETAVCRIMRVNPNIKQFHPSYHSQVRDFIREKQIYEALLVDENNQVTEGSKSNVFFIRGDEVMTAPGSQVLKGITRQKTLLLCKQLNFKLSETFISTDQLSEMEAVFITGTSPKILPVNKIDTLSLKTNHPVMRSLMKAYDGMLREYIENRKG
jgi:branched-chain amino acid aminotransferase